MGMFLSLSTLALRPLLRKVSGSEAVANAAVGFLQKHFTDHSLKLTKALQQANAHAWRALEIALAGESWWGSVKVALAPAEERAFRAQVLAFLQATPLPGRHGEKDFRQKCLRDLQAARKAGLLTGGRLGPEEL